VAHARKARHGVRWSRLHYQAMGSFERFTTKAHFNSLKRLVLLTGLATTAVKLLVTAAGVADAGGSPLDLLARLPASVADLARRTREAARHQRPHAHELARLLETHAAILGTSAIDTSGRLATARAAARLLDDLERAATDTMLVELLDAAELPTEDQAVGRSTLTAAPLVQTLSRTRWELLDALGSDPDPEAGQIRAELARVGALNEFQAPLQPALEKAERDAVRLLTSRRPQPPPPPPPPQPPGNGDEPATLALDPDAITAGAEELVGRLRLFAERHPGRRVRVTWQAEP